EETAKFQEGVFGQRDAQTLRAISHLAIDYGLNNDYGTAREWCQLAYQRLSEATAGVSATEVLISWYIMAWALRLEGKYDEARDVGEEAWDYGKERLRPDHFATLRTAIG